MATRWAHDFSMHHHLKAISYYLAIITAAFVLTGSVLLLSRSAPQPGGNLVQKIRYYETAAARYDMIFLGDSRTYCGLHPEQLDPLLGTHSLNLAHWSNWFPTQYAFLQDLLPHIPQGTVVVWSLGHANFTAAPVQPTYPIGWTRLGRMSEFGLGIGDLWANLAEWTPGLNLFTLRSAIVQTINRIMNRRVATLNATPTATADPAPPDVTVPQRQDDLLARLAVQPGITGQQSYFDGGELTSIGVSLANGAYTRIETKPEFYRRIQRQAAIPQGTFAPTVSPARWALFLAMLDQLRQADVHVIVNVLEEAPYTYGSREAQDGARAFMNADVRHAVEARGFKMISADFNQLNDDQYFDHNHLNSAGVDQYSRLLVDAIRNEFKAQK